MNWEQTAASAVASSGRPATRRRHTGSAPRFAVAHYAATVVNEVRRPPTSPHALARRSDDEWHEGHKGGKAAFTKALRKARDHGLYLGLEKAWLHK